MCNLTCGVVTAVLGSILVVGSCLVSFLLVPDLVQSIIKNEVILLDDTIQFERFEEVPFPLTFNFRIFRIANHEEVLTGAVPIMEEVGPYVYKLYQRRNITYAAEDILRYRRIDDFEFDAEASFPLTEDDLVTIINVPYHAIIQIAQQSFPNLVSILNLAMSSVFGEHNSPIMTVRVGDLLLDGIRICANPGLLGGVACSIIRDIGSQAQNIVEQEDGSLIFSLIDYRNGKPSIEHEIYRGIENSAQLGHLRKMDGLPYFQYWVRDGEEPGLCNMINGTDSGIFAPFLDREKSIYAINTDICRSVELRYQFDVDIDGIPAVHFSSNEWLFDNHEGCFCLNITEGINDDNGCLLTGAMEMFTCVGAMLVLSYPHFLYGDQRYRNGVIGMTPREMEHRIFLEIEPCSDAENYKTNILFCNAEQKSLLFLTHGKGSVMIILQNTGTPIRGAKRAQFNIFQRPISSIPATSNLRLTLVPIVWVEESIDLKEEFKNELRSRLLGPLNLLDILIPVLIAACCLVLLVGLFCVWRARKRQPHQENGPVLQTAVKE